MSTVTTRQMVRTAAEALLPDGTIDYDRLITSDDTPVESHYAEKQMRLLTGPLYECWTGPGENRPYSWRKSGFATGNGFPRLATSTAQRVVLPSHFTLSSNRRNRPSGDHEFGALRESDSKSGVSEPRPVLGVA